MEAKVERIDHLGIITGVIKDLKLIELIDARIDSHPKEEITTGEAVAGMIINGLGFSDRPLSLTPQFFENKALRVLFREDVTNEHFNRFKLGRALDLCHDYGCEKLFTEISLAVCKQEGIDCRFNSLDTTTFSVTGEYNEDTDEELIEMTYGYSKDHRPDLKQAVLELMVSQDGGIPLLSKSWSGNTSDTEVFRQRVKSLINEFKAGKTPRYLVADSKLYDEKTLEFLESVPFITRVPATIKLETQTIEEMCASKNWMKVDENHRYLTKEINHYGLQQRWIVVWSKEAEDRANKRVIKERDKEKEKTLKLLDKHGKRKFSCVHDAQSSLELLNKGLKFYEVKMAGIIEHKVYETKGRPTSATSFQIVFEVKGTINQKEEVFEKRVKAGSCYVLATTIPKKELEDTDVIAAYKQQNSSVEKGFRFLKDPFFFTSSLFVKKVERIMGLLMVMTLALLVYSIAQRRLRAYLREHKQTLPNQIKQAISNPTLRWVFQLLEGIEIVTVQIGDIIHETISGLNDQRKNILKCFPPTIQAIYRIAV